MIHVLEQEGTISAKKWTFDDFYKATNAMASYLLSKGLKPKERVVLRLDNSPDFIVAFLGAIKMGAIPIPTSIMLKPAELDFIFKDSQASGLITTKDVWSHDVGPVVFMDEIRFSSFAPFLVLPTLMEDPAYWLYTSGTEGQPKGVIHAHRSILAHDERVLRWQSFQENDVVFNTSALNWSYALTGGLLDIWRFGGTSLVYNGSCRPDLLKKIVDEFGVSIFMSVPGIYRRLADYLEKDDSGFEPVRVCLCAGEKLPGEVREKFIKVTGTDIYEGLGMTEHSVYLVQPYGERIRDGSCGRPLFGKRIDILDEQLNELGPDCEGILASHKSCMGLMLGYHDAVGAGVSRPGFMGDWFLSGDVARYDEEGNFYFLGRRDDLITAGGYRISPLEVEAVLNTCPDVLESAVVGATLKEGKTIVKAYLVLKCMGQGNCTPTEKCVQSILDYAAQNLAKYKVPRDIVFVSELPKTHNGKIVRKTLTTNN